MGSRTGMEELQLGLSSQGWKISWSRNEWRPPAKSGSVRIKICGPIISRIDRLHNEMVAGRKLQLAVWVEWACSCSPAARLDLPRCLGIKYCFGYDDD